MFHIRPSTKIAQTVLRRRIKWPPELNIETPLNDITLLICWPI